MGLMRCNLCDAGRGSQTSGRESPLLTMFTLLLAQTRTAVSRSEGLERTRRWMSRDLRPGWRLARAKARPTLHAGGTAPRAADGALVLDSGAHRRARRFQRARREDGSTRYHEAAYRLGHAVSSAARAGWVHQRGALVRRSHAAGTVVKVTLAARIDGVDEGLRAGVLGIRQRAVARRSVEGARATRIDMCPWTRSTSTATRRRAEDGGSGCIRRSRTCRLRVRALSAAVASDKKVWPLTRCRTGRRGGRCWRCGVRRECCGWRPGVVLPIDLDVAGVLGRKLAQPALEPTVPFSTDGRMTGSTRARATGLNTAYASAIGDGAAAR